ncbi:FAD-binding protein [Aureimonas fodinaquatilis]|uniref:FAD-binding protein n=1 Tax=Aureimonas fodinaquatilis TaxID=2565783 RepID=A0A5B0E329_9HYPH|nr:FAD-binding protein [Aureimonas fodinaquatilis]KAA0972160.1 FAD-binding protein [Aureimonas fodinaquatilis]
MASPRPISATTATDVLVLGGGPAAVWAALAAAKAGVRVVLADKGYCGTSGATAAANTHVWDLPAGQDRDGEVERRLTRATGLAERDWLVRVMEQATRGLDDLAGSGFPFPVQGDGAQYRGQLRGPDYMSFMRRRILLAGVTILDHHPGLELLSADGVVAGAICLNVRSGQLHCIKAGAVVIATGGCTFLSRALGCDGNTGDGYLMGVEAGARLSAMEFSGQYGISPSHSSVTKGMPYGFATLTLEDGQPLPINSEKDRFEAIASAMISGHTVYARLDRATDEEQIWLRKGQPNCFLPFDRIGINPFTQRFSITLRSEGTVRGVGGLLLDTEDCATTAPGLYAAGDAASRERIVGSSSGGGRPNAAWAIASGSWSGGGAARFARSLGNSIDDRQASPLGHAGLRPQQRTAADDFSREATQAVREEILPLDMGFYRDGMRIATSLKRLNLLWDDIKNHLTAQGPRLIRAREAAAMTATARWIWTSTLHRPESRGLNRRTDHPALNRELTRSIILSEVDTPRVRAGDLKIQGVAA